MDENEFLDSLKASIDFTGGRIPEAKQANENLKKLSIKLTMDGFAHLPANVFNRLLDEDIAMIREAYHAALSRAFALPHPLHYITDTHMRKPR